MTAKNQQHPFSFLNSRTAEAGNKGLKVGMVCIWLELEPYGFVSTHCQPFYTRAFCFLQDAFLHNRHLSTSPLLCCQIAPNTQKLPHLVKQGQTNTLPFLIIYLPAFFLKMCFTFSRAPPDGLSSGTVFTVSDSKVSPV